MTPDADPLSAWLAERLPHVAPEERQRLARDFECYRRELPRLLAEGHANRFAVIKDGQLVSLWDTASDALQAAQEQFGLEPFAVNKVNPLDVQRLPRLDAKLGAAGEAACPS